MKHVLRALLGVLVVLSVAAFAPGEQPNPLVKRLPVVRQVVPTPAGVEGVDECQWTRDGAGCSAT